MENTSQTLMQIHNNALCVRWKTPCEGLTPGSSLSLQFLQKDGTGSWLEEYLSKTKYTASASPEELAQALQVCFDIYAYAMDVNNPEMGSHSLEGKFDALTAGNVDTIRLGTGENPRIFENAKFRIEWYTVSYAKNAFYKVFERSFLDVDNWCICTANCATALPAAAPFEEIQYVSHEILRRLNRCKDACITMDRNFDYEIVNVLEGIEGMTAQYAQTGILLENAPEIQHEAFDKYLMWYLMKKNVTLDKLAEYCQKWVCENDGRKFSDYLAEKAELPDFQHFLNNEYVDDSLIIQFLDYNSFAEYLQDRIGA